MYAHDMCGNGGKDMKKFGIKEVVAIGIGTALFVALTEVQIPVLVV